MEHVKQSWKDAFQVTCVRFVVQPTVFLRQATEGGVSFKAKDETSDTTEVETVVLGSGSRVNANGGDFPANTTLLLLGFPRYIF